MFSDSDADLDSGVVKNTGSVIKIGTSAGMYDQSKDEDGANIDGSRTRSKKNISFSQIIGTSACHVNDGELTNIVALGHRAMKATVSATGSIAIGTNALQGITSADDVIAIGMNARANGVDLQFNSWGADTRDVLIGSNVGTEVEAVIANTVAIGTGALQNARAGTKSGVGSNKYVLTPNTIWNTIAIGDGAGSNALMTSGCSSIFIGARSTSDTFMVNAGLANCILIGHGCMGGVLTNDPETRLVQNHLRLAEYEDTTGMVNNKCIIHTDQLENTLPTMVASLGPVKGHVLDGQTARTVVANPLKFFGPMTNMYGSYMAATAIIVLSPGVNGAVLTDMYGVTGRLPEIPSPDNFDRLATQYELYATDLMLHRNIVLFIKPGTLSSNSSSKYELLLGVGAGVDSNLYIVGDTKCNPDQLSLRFCRSVWDSSSSWDHLGTTGLHRSVMSIGDRLTGWDGRARTVNIKTVLARADVAPIITNFDTNSLFWIVLTIKQENQMYRKNDWVYREDQNPIRFTRNKEFVVSTHIPKATPMPTVTVVGGPMPGQFVELSPSIYTTEYDTTNAFYNVYYVTISAGAARYDQINVTFMGAAESYITHVWCIPDDTYTFEGKQP